jgi:cytochrome o ubiquinol oxidase subunit III
MTNTFAIHHEPEANPDLRIPDPHQDTFSRTVLGFWMYIMTDCILFTSLFATYAVLHNVTFGGPSGSDIFSLPYTFTETMCLLFSSVTCGFGMMASLKNKKNHVVAWFILSWLFGASFVAMELHEFAGLVNAGHSWTTSAFLSSFFALVGTHGLHVSVGLLWMTVMMVQVFVMGITIETFRRLVVFSMFWHFLDLVWIFIFTFVYLMGVV